MATSGSTDFLVTETQIINDAYMEIGDLAVGETLGAEEYVRGRRKLNMMVKQWMAPENRMIRGLKVWQREERELTLTAAISFDMWESATAALNDSIPVDVLTVMRRDSDDNETPLTPMLFTEYQAIGDKTATGDPTRYYYERQVTKGVLYLNSIPSDTTDVLDLVVLREIEDFDAVGNNPDFPKGWERALVYNLAIDLCPSSNVPADTIKTISVLAAQSIHFANSFHPDTCELYFEPGRDD